MSEMYVVGLLKKGKMLTGFRLLMFDAGKKEVRDVDTSLVKNILDRKLADIVNLKIENKMFKGVGGSLDRYGTVGKTQSLVILNEVTDKSGKHIGYMCSDTIGNVKTLQESEVIKFARQYGIANGKIVEDSRGIPRLYSIEGSYKIQALDMKLDDSDSKEEYSGLSSEVISLTDKIKKYKQYSNSYESKIVATIERTKKCSDNQKACLEKACNRWDNENIGNVPELDDEIGRLIAELKRFKQYNGSFESKIVSTVESTRVCSDKQRAKMEAAYKKWKEENKEAEKREQEKREQEKREAEKKEAEKKEAEKKEQEKKEAENREAEEKKESKSDGKEYELLYRLNNGRIYVHSIEVYANYPVDVVIPEYIKVNGDVKSVDGIQSRAFYNTVISSVKAGSTISDIGQAAFGNCSRLKSVDISLCRNQHIAMNTFSNCVSLINVKLGEYIERVHEAAFCNCRSLTYIKLPDSSKTIARNAFSGCSNLKKVESKAEYVNESAFLTCFKLEEFDFSCVNTIGSNAFSETGFKELKLPGCIRSIGDRAFKGCYRLKSVEMDDGIETISRYVFQKDKSVFKRTKMYDEFVELESIKTCKSLKHIGNGAFENVKTVYVYTGSVAEAHCVGFGIPYIRIDSTGLDNSTRVRVKSEMIEKNPVELLEAQLKDDGANEAKVEYLMREDKLIGVQFTEQNFKFFGINPTTDKVEPSIVFKAAINYLQDISDLYSEPLARGVLRLQDTFRAVSKELYSDGCNRIIKVKYEVHDNLDSGEFIMVLMDNKLVYNTICNLQTDIEFSNGSKITDNIPIRKFLHIGDRIGNNGTISGRSAIVGDYNAGEEIYERILVNGITLNPQRDDRIIYVPAENIAVKLHDKRKYTKDAFGRSVIADGSADCFNITDMIEYDDLIKAAKKFRKPTLDSNKFFNDLSSMSEAEVKQRVRSIGIVEEEKQAQLYKVSKDFNSKLDEEGVSFAEASPMHLTMDIFNELSVSYWMIEKDTEWMNSTGSKSLNRTNEYVIENYVLTEYKSNQIVKFSNPYMNGCKGAYVFVLKNRGGIVGVYASRYSMQHIVDKLVRLTRVGMSSKKEYPGIMENPKEIKIYDPNLFYTFYDVLYSKNGWEFAKVLGNRGFGFRSIGYSSASYHIAMYKPTGIFYLVAMIGNGVFDGERTVYNGVVPILPIGNMDRALIVATTTNNKAKDSELLTELMNVSHAVISGKSNSYFRNYLEVREMLYKGVYSVKDYNGLICDRAIYMMGTIHKGKLQREYGYSDYIDYGIDDIDNEYNDVEIQEYEEEFEEYLDEDGDAEFIDDIDEESENEEYSSEEDEYIDEDDDEDEFYIEDDEFEDEDSVVSDADVEEMQRNLKEHGYDMSLEQVRAMIIQQMINSQ